MRWSAGWTAAPRPSSWSAPARCLEAAHQVPAAIQKLQRALDEFGETDYANQARITLAELQGGGASAGTSAPPAAPAATKH